MLRLLALLTSCCGVSVRTYFDHVKRSFDVGSLVIVRQEFLAVVCVEAVPPSPKSVDLEPIVGLCFRVRLEGNVRN